MIFNFALFSGGLVVDSSGMILAQNILREKLEDLKVLKRSPDLLNNVKIGYGQLRLIIQTYFV